MLSINKAEIHFFLILKDYVFIFYLFVRIKWRGETMYNRH
jgi:hypothetical protein